MNILAKNFCCRVKNVGAHLRILIITCSCFALLEQSPDGATDRQTETKQTIMLG